MSHLFRQFRQKLQKDSEIPVHSAADRDLGAVLLHGEKSDAAPAAVSFALDGNGNAQVVDLGKGDGSHRIELLRTETAANIKFYSRKML